MSHIRAIRLQAADEAQENCSWYGRFASGARIYAYANGDPINGADPSGLSPGDGAFRDGVNGTSFGGSQGAAGVGQGGSGGSGGGGGNGGLGGSGNNSSHEYAGGSVGWTSQEYIRNQADDIAHYPELGRFFSQGYEGDATAAAVASGEEKAAAGFGAMLRNGTGGTALVGGFFDYTQQGTIYRAYLSYVSAGLNASYFTWDQGSALGGFIDANRGQVNVIGHSYGGDTAASVVAAGHGVLNLTTIDPVGWFRPDFASVRANAGSWTDYNATGGSSFERTNLIAGIGGAYGTSPAGYATTFRNLPYTHGQIGCVAGGC